MQSILSEKLFTFHLTVDFPQKRYMIIKSIHTELRLFHSIEPAAEAGEDGTDTSGYFLADPMAGLEGLQNYTASLVITFSGTQDDQPLAFSDSYRQEVNQQSGTRFTWSSVTGMDGAAAETVTGKVGGAYYTRLQGGKCNVSWVRRAEGVEPLCGDWRSIGEWLSR